MQALMLAAGMGRRLGKYTGNQTKCMVKVGEKTLLEHTIDALKQAEITKLIMVVGFEAERLKNFIKDNISGIQIEFVDSPDYATTNNIYSLFLAKEKLVEDDTIMVESDLIYDVNLIREIVEDSYPNIVAVAKYEHWMDGTVTLLTTNNYIKEFVEKKDFHFQDVGCYYKTVNIYKFSKEFSKNQYIPFLTAYIQAYGKNQYYELVLKALAHLSNADLKAFILSDQKWYEIDDAQDLDIANTLFSVPDKQLQEYECHFGGYWRFSGLKDYCYLVNPYFPPQKMIDQMKCFFDPLLRNYPSGMNIQKLISAKMFHLDESHILVGNGAAELINTLGQIIKGKVAISIPAFNEYIRCFRQCEFQSIYSKDNNFLLDKNELIRLSKKCNALFIINPDNPSGSFLEQNDILEILDACHENGTTCVIDESFIDFAEKNKRYTLLSDNILEKYPELIVIKSISKSYGIPGIRLGVLASTNVELLEQIKALLPVWNINSFGEYFLQIYGLYSFSYEEACNKIAEQRTSLMEKLQQISFLTPYKSQANYIMCQVNSEITAKELATKMINEYNLLIKDLSSKNGFANGQYVRFAVKDEVENILLFKTLQKIDQEILAQKNNYFYF